MANGTPPPATFNYMHRVSYPLWVGTVYHPALALRSDLYQRYLQWWDNPSEKLRLP